MDGSRSKSKNTVKLHLYISSISITALAILVAFSTESPQDWGGLLLFSLLICFFQVMAVWLPGNSGNISLAFLPTLSVIMLFHPFWAALVSAVGFCLGMVFFSLRVNGLAFNFAQWTIATLASSQVYIFTGGMIGSPDWQASLLPAVASGIVFQIINTFLVAIIISLNDGSPFPKIWRNHFKWSAPNYLALIPLALALAIAYDTIGFLGVAFFSLPLLVARYAFQLHEDLRRTFLGTIGSLAAALDAKDPYTAGHSQRVGDMAALIGREMGLPEKQIEHLQIAGTLHDIGKIGIPDAVLLKPGRFTPEEYATMKQHAVLSGKILADIEQLGDVARWIACHHERWDGQGYPDGHRGEQVPLGARILAVADACDAMLSRRSYKDSFSWEKTRAELERCTGKDFDPAVVEAMISVADRPEAQKIIQSAVGTSAAEAAPTNNVGPDKEV